MADLQDRRPIHLADAPFDDPSGDIILRCGTDRLVEFRTHKIFLAHASPVFETMFSLPQEHQGVAQTSDVPVVFMPDDAENLRTLLLYCYPGTTPETPSSLEELYRLYRVADKYALDDARVWVRNCLPLFMERAPIGVYVLAAGGKMMHIEGEQNDCCCTQDGSRLQDDPHHRDDGPIIV